MQTGTHIQILPPHTLLHTQTHTKCSRRVGTASLSPVNPQIIRAVLAGIRENHEKQEVKEVEGMSAVTKQTKIRGEERWESFEKPLNDRFRFLHICLNTITTFFFGIDNTVRALPSLGWAQNSPG